jgi:hypothetical protein
MLQLLVIFAPSFVNQIYFKLNASKLIYVNANITNILQSMVDAWKQPL